MQNKQTQGIAGSHKTDIKNTSARDQRATFTVHVNRCPEIPPGTNVKYSVYS
jgi:hypothetical protein